MSYYNEVVWSRQSLDLILGLVGGFVGLIWTVAGWLLSDYQDFAFQKDIIAAIYPVSPQPDDVKPDDRKDDGKDDDVN